MKQRAYPWTDKGGRFSRLKAGCFALALAPGLWEGSLWCAHMITGDVTKTVTHFTGLWAVRFLLLSLSVSPAKAVLGWTRVATLRRMLGVTALAYAAIHLGIYIADQGFRLGHVVSEIALRFYLTIGFVALLGLAALGVTSTDAMVRRLGATWRRLHRLAYPIAFLALLHFFLQTKADVAQAVVYTGIFLWLMAWRLLPAGPDRKPLVLLALAPATWLATLAIEYGWYAVATKVPPSRVLRLETSLTFGAGPAAQAACLALALAAIVGLRRLALRTDASSRLWQVIGVYAGGALIAGGLGWAFGLTPGDEYAAPGWLVMLIWIGLAAGLGIARWRLAGRAERRMIDVLWLLCLAYPAILPWLDDRGWAGGGDAVAAALALVLAARVWPASRGGAAAALPLVAWLAVIAAGLA